jgi:phage terminase small subunit
MDKRISPAKQLFLVHCMLNWGLLVKVIEEKQLFLVHVDKHILKIYCNNFYEIVKSSAVDVESLGMLTCDQC